LPKFEVKVDIPSYMVTSEPQLTGTASAKYTFGKPLTDARVLVTAKFRYYYSRDGTPQPTLTRMGQLDSKGEFSFSFANNDLLDLAWRTFYNYQNARREYLSLDYRQLEIIVNVTNTRTGHQMGADASLRFHRDPAKVTFLPISAGSYKPGLKYTAHVVRPERLPFPPPYWEPEQEVVLLVTEKPLAANGFLAIEVDVPTQANRISIRAEAMKTTAYTSANKAVSPSDNFLQLQMTSQNPRVGQTATFSVRTTEPVQKLTYQVYAKGMIVSESEVMASVPTGSSTFTFSFTLDANMAPNCRVLVFYFRPGDGEVVADSMSFKVDAVSVEYSKADVKPGEEVDLTVRAQPSSVVFVLGIDKSVKLLKSGNDITDEMVQEELIGYDYGFRFHGFWRYMVICGWPYPSQGSDAHSVFRDANVAILTDGDVYQQTYNYFYRGGPVMMQAAAAAPGAPMAEGAGFGGGAPAEPDLPVERVRTFFPETWLWDFVILGYSMQRSLHPQECPLPVAWRMGQFDVTAIVLARENRCSLTYISFMAAAYLRRKVGFQVAYSSPLRSREYFRDDAQVQAKSEPDLPVSRVRKFFPETWLFTMLTIGADGVSVERKMAPDTITTWLTTAFAIHPTYGLSVLPQAAEMTMTMGRTEGINNIRLLRTSASSLNRAEFKLPMRVTHRIGVVAPDNVGETTFCFQPTTLGQVPIRVNLTNPRIPGDGVERMLLVEPEGAPRVQSVPVILDVAAGQGFSKVVPISFPPLVVQGSERITVSVAGDLLGPVFDNIDDLLRMPYGCGEQNMLYFAPNVFLIDYLQTTNTYTTEVAATAENYMLVGYQKEIKYQHDDGSYSAFGQSRKNETGSMWLTAFVTKCFVQSMALQGQVVTIDASIVRRSIMWMVSQQSKDGSFPEPGKVFNKNMQGGSAKGEALTAYVLIALAEADVNFQDLDTADRTKLQDAIAKARVYLEQQLTNLTDAYDVAIVSYALHLTDSTSADIAYERLRNIAITGEYKAYCGKIICPVCDVFVVILNRERLAWRSRRGLLLVQKTQNGRCVRVCVEVGRGEVVYMGLHNIQ
ncbi:hypothetical protein BaRGS_00018877, partial [Batillaria attramentaria]